MHAMLTAFFALIFSFGHAQALRHAEALAPPDLRIFSRAPAPTRQEIALTGCTNGYAGSACPSQPMIVSTWNAQSDSRDQPSDSPRPTPPSAAF